MNNMTDRDVDEIVRKLMKFDKEFSEKELKKMQNKAGAPLIKAMKGNIPQSKRPHKRYLRNGKLAATYYPGNLRRSIRRLNFRGALMSWFGPKTTATRGDMKGNKVDGWYAHFVEYGLSPFGRSTGVGFARRAYDSTREKVKSTLTKEITQWYENWESRNTKVI